MSPGSRSFRQSGIIPRNLNIPITHFTVFIMGRNYKSEPSPASVLKSGLQRLQQSKGFWKDIASRTSASLSPSGPGVCDHNSLERCANCVTSLPYFACGLHTMRQGRIHLLGVWCDAQRAHVGSRLQESENGCRAALGRWPPRSGLCIVRLPCIEWQCAPGRPASKSAGNRSTEPFLPFDS